MDVRLPRLGEGADSGTVASIFIKEGDQVSKDQPILELESEKAVASIPSPASGTVTKLHIKEGDEIKVGQMIISLDEGRAPRDSAPGKTRDVAAEVPAEQERSRNEEEMAPGEATRGEAQEEAGDEVRETEEEQGQALELPAPPTDGGAPPAASPSMRKMARDLGIDLRRVKGSERGGRIVMEDVRRYIQRLQQMASQQQARKPVATGGEAPRPAKPAPEPIDFARWGAVRKEKITTLRRTISNKMAESWTTIPHVTQFDEADVTDTLKLRKKYSAAYEKKKAHLTLTSFALKAVVETLKKHPMFNTSLDEASGEIIYKDYYHIGIAVDTEQGLIVPVIRDVDKKSMMQLSAELQELAERTRQRKVSLEEMQGGTFTISNQGGIGSAQFTPIINKPEAAILGMGRGTEKLILRKGKPTKRTMLPLGLSYDHRLIDGANAARFMVDLVAALEGFDEKLMRAK
ncbi:biotin/lipoyl-binding protein [bacterium]|nr:MAG: biotin/lipoyl-binding protein [bacterium]